MGHARLRTHPADRGTGASTQVSGGCRTSGSLLQPEAMKKFILLLGVAGALAGQTFVLRDRPHRADSGRGLGTANFAPPGTGGLSLYNLEPCRALDSRNPPGSLPFTGTIAVDIIDSGCGAPSTAQAYVFNATVVPQN